MRERSTWRWVIVVMLLVLGLLLAAGFPTDAVARFLDHPAHPGRTRPSGSAPSTRGAEWFRIAAIAAAVAWMAGAVALARWRSDSNRPGASPMSRTTTTLLFVTLLLALAIRLPFLGHGLWFDEIAAVGDFTRYGPGPIVGSWFTPSNHVLQTLLSWASATLLGTSEATLRLPSLIAGLASVVAVHAIARRVADDRTASLAALAAAIMPIAVLESTEARGYALMMCFTAVAVWAFVRGMQHGEPWTWLAMAAAEALAVWTHFVAVVVIAGIALVALVDLAAGRHDADRRRRAGSALIGSALAVVLAATLLAPLLPDVIASRAQFRATGSGTPTLASAEGLRVALTPTGTWAAALPTPLAAVPAAVLLLAGIAAGARSRLGRLALAASFTGLPILLLIVIAGGSWTYARFASFVAPGTALAIGLGAAAVMRLHRRLGVALLAMLAASFVAELALLPPRQPLLETVDEMTSRAVAGDRAVDASIRGAPSTFYATPRVPMIGAGVMAADLESRLADPRVRFVILSYPGALPGDRIATLHGRGFVMVRERPGWIDWGGGAVQLWERGARGQPSTAP